MDFWDASRRGIKKGLRAIRGPPSPTGHQINRFIRGTREIRYRDSDVHLRAMSWRPFRLERRGNRGLTPSTTARHADQPLLPRGGAIRARLPVNRWESGSKCVDNCAPKGTRHGEDPTLFREMDAEGEEDGIRGRWRISSEDGRRDK